MNEHEKKPKANVFFVDAKEFTTDRDSMTGAEIKVIAQVDPVYQLFLEEKGNHPDRAISDLEVVVMHGQDKHFYTVPPATFGNHEND